MKPKAILILSGGMDSVTLLYDLLRKYEVYAVSFNYGQRHLKELDCAKKICKKLKVQHKVVDMSSVKQLLKGSALTDKVNVPEGRYDEPNMKLTVVPNRNMMMLSIAMAWAVSVKAKTVFFGAHAGDHAIYPDCREEFVEAMKQVGKVSNYDPVDIQAPYLGFTKGEIAKLGKELKVPYEKTWTCYKGKKKHCGKCGSCDERKEAMDFAGIVEKNFYEN